MIRSISIFGAYAAVTILGLGSVGSPAGASGGSPATIPALPVQLAAGGVKSFKGEWQGFVRAATNSDCSIDVRITRAVVAEDDTVTVQFPYLGTPRNIQFTVNNAGESDGRQIFDWFDHTMNRRHTSPLRITGSFDDVLFEGSFGTEVDELGLACSDVILMALKDTLAASQLLAGGEFQASQHSATISS